VIAPLTSATLRVVPAAQHGIASAAVVVARMIGMLIGIAALSAWGLYRFNQILATKQASIRPDASLLERVAAQSTVYRDAYAEQYGEIFKITAIVCLVGAILGLFISSRREHAEEPEPGAAIDVDETPTQLIDAPTQAFDAPTQTISTRNPDQTVRIQRRAPGRHRPRP
jgi:hypothetical protein